MCSIWSKIISMVNAVKKGILVKNLLSNMKFDGNTITKRLKTKLANNLCNTVSWVQA